MNPSQKINDARPGQPMKADMVNHIIAVVKRMIVDGRGTTVGRMGDQICINASKGPVGNGGGGSTIVDDSFVYGDSFEELPAPVVGNKFGRVTEGDQKGMTCVINADGDGWVPFTHFG